MSVCNKALVGKRAPAFHQTLASKTAAAYAAATDDDNPCYRAPQHLAPPLSVVTLSLVHGVAPLMCDPDMFSDPMSLLRLVHLEEDITWHRPLVQGMALVSQAVLAGIEERSSGEILRVVVEVGEAEEGTDDAVSPVATVNSLMFLRGEARRARRDLVPEDPVSAAQGRTVDWTVAADQSERYAEASGDHNPIHLDDAVAKASGLKARILHGLCTMAFAQRAAVQSFAKNDPARLKRLRLAFARPVYPGDTLTWSGHAMAGAPDNVAFVVKNQAGRVVGAEGLAVF